MACEKGHRASGTAANDSFGSSQGTGVGTRAHSGVRRTHQPVARNDVMCSGLGGGQECTQYLPGSSPPSEWEEAGLGTKDEYKEGQRPDGLGRLQVLFNTLSKISLVRVLHGLFLSSDNNRMHLKSESLVCFPLSLHPVTF